MLLTKAYPGSSTLAMDNVYFQAKDGEILVLLGSFVIGKTNLMKMINRLIEPMPARIKIDSKDIIQYKLSFLRRSIGYVFQQIGLFTHITVEKNITTLLKLLHVPKKKRIKQAYELFDLVHLDY